MIPTSVTSSSPPAASLGSIGNQINNSPTLSGSAKSSNGASGTVTGQGQGNYSAFLGIASLILEGRALADDEYAIQKTSKYELKTSLCGTSSECGRQSPKPSTSRAAFGESTSGGMGTSSFPFDLANYLGRKSSRSPESTSSSFLREYCNSSSSESASSSVESNHSRWSQKLSQLRQESPNAHHQAMAARQKVSVECPRGSEAEYVALAINTDHHHPYGLHEDKKGGDFEILRRMSINQMNFYNSPNSMGGGGGGSSGGGGGGGSSENFMCSLQSLASNTCLRVGSPLLLSTTSTPKYLSNRQISSSTTKYTTPQQQQQQQQQLDYSLGTSSCSSGSSGGGVSVNSWYASSSPHSGYSSGNNSSNNNKDYIMRKSSTPATTKHMAIPSPQIANIKNVNSSTSSHNLHSIAFSRNNISSITAAAATASMSAAPAAATLNRNQTYPQQGPHCDQFLRKMGLAKSDASETEEHHCDMSYVNITCTRWRAYCIKMENILARGEPICIEVYLGPVGHKVLLEQWIITQKEKQPPPTMTLPSLCSAIRSQLYFSQISAWCDLIKKSDKTINETGRIIHTTPPTTSAAGDLATTMNNAITAAPIATSTTSTHHPTAMSSLAATSPTAGSANISGGVAGLGCGKRRPSAPRLNIFYRIKQYDSSIACFNSKPNVHNFPNVNISENCSVSVCLKSLPRITGGIPKLGTAPTATTISRAQQNLPQSGLTAATSLLEKAPVSSTTSANCIVAKNIPLATATATATTAKVTTSCSSATSNAANVAANVAVAAAAVAAATTTTTNANKSTILKMNCDNNLKEQQQQLKPFTASCSTSSASSSSSLRCSYSTSKNNSKQYSAEDDNAHDQDVEYLDFGYYDDYNVDLSAGGDNSNSNCTSLGSRSSEVVGAAGIGDCDISNSPFSTNSCGHLSHREKQLLKYRKRMLKRDKKQQLRKNNENFSSNQIRNQMQHQNQTEKGNNNNIRMEQGEDDDCDDDDNVHEDGNKSNNSCDTAECSEQKYSVNSLTKGQRQQLPNNPKNSIPCTNQIQQQQQQHHVKMISTGTQTITNTCTSCGSEKSMICLKCNPFRSSTNDDTAVTITVSESSYNYEEIMDAETSSASSLSSSDIIHTPRNKAELLLQAIQRTPKSNKKLKHKSKHSNQMAAIKQKQHQQQQQQHQKQSSPTTTTIVNTNSNLRNSKSTWKSSSTTNNSSNDVLNGIASSISNNNMIIGCQMCKRQKTQHNFQQSASEETTPDVNNSALPKSSLNSSSNIEMSVSKNTNQTQSSTDDDDDDDKTAEDGDNEKDGGIIPSSDSIDNVPIVIDCVNSGGSQMTKMSSAAANSFDNFTENDVMEEEEYFETSTKLTPQIDRCSLNVKISNHYAQMSRLDDTADDGIEYQPQSCSTPPLGEQKGKSSLSEGPTMLAQFKTPTLSDQYQNAMKGKTQQPLQPHKHTPKPNLLHIAFNFNKTDDEQQISKLNFNRIMNNNHNNNTPTTHNPLLLRRSLPKVNLTPIFCNPNSMMAVSSSPIPIGNGVCHSTVDDLAMKSSEDINVTEASPTFSFESPSSPAPVALVQKSNSAPTLPNSPSLSPRFVKAAAIYKRRSRHLSDRSSLGSDEQISDEEIYSGMYSPFATSPVKVRTRLAAVFGRQPLLGNLEESLLQRRLIPKIEVMGFKLLLGASGGFCPTQLTIPAAAYFYELKGESLTTPYLCEIRLPRKGYTVPRCGTVQATLLNPMGTVVRMFVIPYDMRDMPTLHQTFIRQRILADAGMQCNDESNQNGTMNQLFDGVSRCGSAASASAFVLNAKPQKMEQEHPTKKQQHKPTAQQQRSPQCSNENQLGHFISADNMRSLRYSIHLRFQTSRTGRLMLHTDIRLLISRRTDCDTAAAHAKGVLEAPNELVTNTVMPTNPKYSARQDQTTSKI